MAKRLASLITLLTLLVSCSNSQISKNTIKHGESLLAGGVSENSQWSEHMVLKRTSWYRSFTLLFDTHLWKVEPKSEFNKWFSADEKKYLKRCSEFYIILTYFFDSDLISDVDFYKQLKAQNADFISLSTFKANMKLHPQFFENSFNAFKVGGLCKKKTDPLFISFPGFQKTNI